MKLRTAVVVAAGLMMATPVFAQPPHDWHGHKWHKGERVPAEWQGHDREVDWHHEHLRRPPHGYHWVRDDDGNYLLAALAGGAIASIIMGHH
jgi:Ni/Co efflux regulator RcnB